MSRFETGERQMGWTSASQIAAYLEMDAAELVAMAHRLPPNVADQLAAPTLALGLVGLVGEEYQLPDRTRQEIRRLHIKAMVERDFPAPSRRDTLPDPAKPLRTRHYSVETNVEWKVPRIELDGRAIRIASGDPADERFEMAHALGHVVLETRCDTANLVADAELDASAFASYYLLPSGHLDSAVSRAPRLDIWKGDDVGALLTMVAQSLQVPAWVVARRASEEGSFARRAEVAG
jgi:hypothetical protein